MFGLHGWAEGVNTDHTDITEKPWLALAGATPSLV